MSRFPRESVELWAAWTLAASMVEVSAGTTIDWAVESIGLPDESTNEVVVPVSVALMSICESCMVARPPLKDCNPAPDPNGTLRPLQRDSKYPSRPRPITTVPTPPNPAC